MRTLYRTRFWIEPSGELEQERLLAVSSACIRWALGQEGMDDATREAGATLLEDPVQSRQPIESESSCRLAVKSVAELAPTEWAMRFSRPDSEDPQLRWTVDIALREDDQKRLDAVCEVFLAREDGLILPVVRDSARPKVLVELVQAFPCVADRRVLSTPRSLLSGQLSAYVDFLRDPGRQLPVVCITPCHRTQRPVLAPRVLANRLTGLAHVYAVGDRFVTRELEDVHGLPSRLNAWDGAIRVYWPGMSYTDDERGHHLWLRQYLEQQSDWRRIQLIVRPVALAAVAQHDTLAPSWSGLERRERRARMAKLIEDGATAEELLDDVDSANRDLETRNEQLQKELADAEEQIYFLKQERDGLLLSIAELSKGDQAAPAREAPSSLEESVEFAREDHKDTLEFVLNSASSVAGNPFERPEEALAALEFLATTWRDAKLGLRPSKDLDIDLRERCGWTYRPSQSENTMKRWPNEYSTIHRGRRVWLGAHLCTRAAKDPRHSLRIAFAWDEASERAVVGYIGQHQRTLAS